jgi:phage replication O-like protein O
MDNVIQLSNTQRGFTRMDNELYEALIGADLSGRELRVALAIHRFTVGYNMTTSRIAASTIAQLANLRREHVSRMVSELIRQRVIYRAGGSKGPLGISPVSEWKIDPKNEDKKAQPKAAQCAISGTSLVPFPAHIKDRKDINTTDVVLSASVESVQALPAKASSKSAKPKADTFTLSNLLLDNPHGASEQVLADWLTCRKSLKAAVTATVWKRVNAELAKCAAEGISADDALAEAQEAGWRGFKAEWVANRRSNDRRQPARQSTGPDFHSGDTSWASDLGDL